MTVKLYVEMVTGCIKVLFQHFHGLTKGSNEKSQFRIITHRAKQGSYTGPPKY